MGMPITIEIIDNADAGKSISKTFDYFAIIDDRFSTYKKDSEISRINRGLPKSEWSGQMSEVMRLCEQTKRETNGYFDSKKPDGSFDPSGLVKGWAIQQASEKLLTAGIENFYIEAGGDIAVSGTSASSEPWKIGIRNPFNMKQIVKTIVLSDGGVATSGTYIRGQHIHNPHEADTPIEVIKSLTVIGPTIYDADRFATAAFAMGRNGIAFIESLKGFEGYMIDEDKTATMTSGFERYVI